MDILVRPFYDFGKFDDRWLDASIGEGAWHFHRRLYERYGAILGPGEYSKIVRKTKRPKTLLRKRADGTTLHRIYVESAWDFVFIVARKGQLITAMPPMRKVKQLQLRGSVRGQGDTAA